MLEVVALTYALLKRSKCRGDVALALLVSLKMFAGDSITMRAMKLMQSIMNTEQAADDPVDFSTGMRDIPLFKMLVRSATLATSSALLMKAGLGIEVTSLLTAYAEGAKQFIVEADFVTSVVNLVRYIIGRVSQCFETGSISPIFHTQATHTAWVNRAFQTLEEDAIFRLPGQDRVDESVHMSNLEDMIVEGMEVLKFHVGSDARVPIASTLSKLRLARATHLVRYKNGAAREAPFALLVCGRTSAGKSSFVEQLYYHYGKVCNKPIEPKFKYTRTFSDDYWTDFRSHMWCIVLDDVACPNPNKASDDPSLNDIIALVNNVPFAPPQADIENKGTPARPEFVIGTTNTPHLNAAVWFSNPAAVRRRFRYNLYISPKPEYADAKNADALRDDIDPNPPPGCYFDLWHIRVTKVVARRSGNDDAITQEAFEVEYKTFTEIYSFMEWFNEVVQEYKRQQDGLKGAFESVRSVTLCDQCHIPEAHCRCVCPHCGSAERACACAETLLADAHARVQGSEVSVYDQTQSSPPWGAMGIATATAAAGAALYVHRGALPTPSSVYERARGAIADYSREKVLAALAACKDEVWSRCKPVLRRVLMVLAGLASACAAYRMYNSYTLEEQSSEEPSVRLSLATVGVTPEPAGDVLESPYQVDKYSRVDLDYAPLVRSWSGLERTKVNQYILRNTFGLIVRRVVDGVTKRTNGVCLALGGHLYVTTNHLLATEGDLQITFMHEPIASGPSRNMTKRYTQSMLHRVPERELVFFQNRDYTAKVKMIQLVPQTSHSARAPGWFCRKTTDGESAAVPLECVSDEGTTTVPDGRPMRVWGYETPNAVGHCGTPVVQYSRQGPLIVGLHYLGTHPATKCQAVSLTQDVVQDAIRHFGDLLVEPSPPMLDSEYRVVTVGPNHPKSVLMYVEDDCTIHNYGTTNIPRASSKSKVARTILADAAEQAGYTQEHFAPPMSGWQVGRNQILPILQQERLTDEHLLRECSDAYIDEVMAGLSEEDKAEAATILSVEAAINGVPGTRFIDSMNFKTSAGFPSMATKRHVTVELPPDDLYQVKRTFTKPVLDRAEVMYQRYVSGRRASPIAVKHNKDEPRSAAKVSDHQTRAINGLPVDHSLVARMHTSALVRVIMKNKLLFEAAPGLVAQSREWHHLAQYLSRSGSGQKIDGDYKWYDLKAGASWILEAFRAIREILRRCGATQEHLRVVECMGEDVAFCFVCFDGDLYEFFGHNPSGHTLTVVINCLMNSFYSRYAYKRLHPLGEVRDYRMFVSQITYGDDDTKDVMVPWFCHNNISEELARIGVTYTAADKSTGDVPFRTIDQVTFLKRSFRWEAELEAYVAPLDEASIGKMLVVSLPSDKHVYVDAGERVVTAAREYFWYGREVFEAKIPVLRSILRASVPESYATVEFPTWEQLVEEYRAASVDSDRYMGIESLRRAREYVDGLYAEGHRERVLAMTVQAQEVTEIHTNGSVPRDLFWDLMIARVQMLIINTAVFYTLVAAPADRILQRNTPRGGLLVDCAATAVRVWFGMYASVLLPVHLESTFGVQIGWISGPVDYAIVLFLILRPIVATHGGVRSARVHVSRWKVTCLMWACGTLLGCVVHMGRSSSVPLVAKPKSNGSLPICLERAHGAEECAGGPSRLGRTPESLFRDGRRWEPVQEPTQLMDVCWGEKTSGQTNNNNNNHATRSLTEVDLSRKYHIQSDEFTESAASAVIQQENLKFVDSGVVDAKLAPGLGPFQPDSDDVAGLATFLNRPVLINSFDWLESNVVTEQTSFSPWTLYFSDPGVRKKLDNYSRIRCKLHVKFVYNASPFYFGSMRVCYFPLRAKHVIDDAGDQMRVSQAPGLYIEPQRGTTSSMELPFVWPGVWADLRNMADMTAMGSMHYVRFAALRSANGVSSAKVRISCYAWATDVELAGPTTFAVQASEYDEMGPVSGPASAVAAAAGALSDAPVIGPMATAAEIGARAVSNIARVFGFSNPPVIDDVAPVAPKSFHAFANVDTRLPIDKLTVDPKNEVTMDNTVTGYSADDELTMSSLLGRESFLTGTSWTQVQLEGAQLFAAAVHPAYCFQSVDANHSRYAWTPAAYFSQFFNYWRGGVTYRFKFIKSRYHTGRVMISWDPQGQPGADAETLTLSRLVDIQEEDEVTITIPFKARTPWLDLPVRDTNYTNGSGAISGYDDALHNGVIKVYVQNTLTGPADNAQITMLVYVSGATDLSYCVPREVDTRYMFAPQGEETEESPPDDSILAGLPQPALTAEMVTVGETIGSIRQLVHRASWVELTQIGCPWLEPTQAAPAAARTAGYWVNTNLFPRIPMAFGRSALGSSYIQRLDDTSKYRPGSMCRTHLVSYVLNCFAGYRGSFVHHFNVLSNGNDYMDTIAATRHPGTPILLSTKALRSGVSVTFQTGSYNITALLRNNVNGTSIVGHESGFAGTSITNPRTQSAMSVSVPYYSKWRFRPAWEFDRDIYPSDSTSNEHESVRLTTSGRQTVDVQANSNYPFVDHYFAAGTDFNPVFFVCAPDLWIANATPVFASAWTPAL
jgi:hypothetical protein